MTDQELDDYISKAQQKSRETGLPIIRQDSVLAPAYKPQQEESILPTLGGLVGGVAGGLLIKNPLAGATAGRAFMGSLLPSLAGSSIGTAAGTAAERGIAGDLLSGEGGKQMVGNLLENAAWDLGGNLVFGLAGKTYRVGKDMLSKGGITTEQEARNAAQKWLSEKGATLSLGQLEGTRSLMTAESFLKGGTGGGEFAKQEQGVSKAVQQGLNDVKSSLQTSEAFNQAIKSEEPLNLAAGESFKNLITTARGEFKDKYRPFYQSLSEDYGVYVDIRKLKDQAKEELLRIEKIKGAGSSADRKEVLDQILKQDDFLDFGAAHDLRSGFNGAANDLKIPGKNATSKEAAYSKYANDIDSQMGNAMQMAASNPTQLKNIQSKGYIGFEQPQAGSTVITGNAGFNPGMTQTPVSKKLIQEYNDTTTAYKAGMDGLFNETVNTAMSMKPSKVGAYLADLSSSENYRDLYKTVSQIDKYIKTGGKESVGMLADVKYNFINDAISTPEKALKFNEQLKSNPDLKAAFYKMFRSEAPQIKDLLNAADIGLSKTNGASYYLSNRLAGTAYQGTGAITGYFLLPDSVQDRLKDNLPQAAVTAGALLLTPKILAKAATNKDAADALAKLAQFKQGNKMSGAAAVKLVDQLNKAKIIDSEYVSTIDSIFNAPQDRQTVTSMPVSDIDLDKYIQSKQQQ
jgi:hypothetical protein